MLSTNKWVQQILIQVYKKVGGKSSGSLLYAKPCKTKLETGKFTMKYIRQHKAIRKSMHKHWRVWLADHRASSFIQPVREMLYRIATSVRDTIVQSCYKGSDRIVPTYYLQWKCKRQNQSTLLIARQQGDIFIQLSLQSILCWKDEKRIEVQNV